MAQPKNPQAQDQQVLEKSKTPWVPSVDETETLNWAYGKIDLMVERRNYTYPEFNDVNLVDFIDDSERRLNAYVPSRESQGKEDWQANVALTTVRDKQRKLIAGYSLKVPEVNFTAYGPDMSILVDRGDIAKNLVIGSYMQETNPVLDNFWECWEVASKGTVVEYEGYLKSRVKQNFVTKYDIVTGEIESEEREVDVDDKCISYILPLTEFYIWNYYQGDVQLQPRVAWIRYMDEEDFDLEFSKYQNWKFVKMSSQVTKAETDTFYYKYKWSTRCPKDKIELVRLYDMGKDLYLIIANGVILLQAPLLWSVNGKKVFPFAKTILEPFANRNFFYGNSLPNILAGQYDVRNTIMNSMLDKEYRSLVRPLLIGRVNQDTFELEDEIVTGDTKIYVENVDQVKPMEINGVDSADIALFDKVGSGIDDVSPSLPSLQQSGNPTAREIVLAEEKLREVKSLYSEMITDLWIQKCQLRLSNIQQNYPQPRMVPDPKNPGKTKKMYRTYIIPNAVLDKETGEKGVLAVQFMDVKPKDKRKMEAALAVEEQTMMAKGIKYKKVICSTTFLDNAVYQVKCTSESLYKISLAKMQATVLEKVGTVAKLFPQIFATNQDEFFSDFMEAYDEEPQKYLDKYKAAADAAAKMQQGIASGANGDQPPQGTKVGGGGQPVPQNSQAGGGENQGLNA